MKQLKQLDLFAQSDLVDTTISAEQYQLQHAHSNILKKPLDEVPAGGKKEKWTNQWLDNPFRDVTPKH